jgi:hypothetical protein
MQSDDTYLDDCWTLYFHDPDDRLWTQSSYKKMGNINTVQDWVNADCVFTDMWNKGMFFVMREHIQPLWEDPNNKMGGCFSYKVNKPDVADVWFKMCCIMLGNRLCKSEDSNIQDAICGMSISPKRSYCILRIWIGCAMYGNTALYNINPPDYTSVLFKTHEQNNDFVTDT